jgi:hypothetical protein
MSRTPNRKLKAKIIEVYGTQVDFARLINWSEDRVSRVIHGRVIPGEDEKRLISRKLGVPPGDLFQEA